MRKRHLSTITVIATFALSLIGIFYLRPHLNEIDIWLTHIGLLGPLAAILLYGLLSLTPVPTDPLTIILGALYGPLWGTIISLAGNTFASLVEYFVAYHLGNLTHFSDLRPRLPWNLGTAPIDSAWFLILGRFVPGFGSKFVSVMAGLYRVPLAKYLWTSTLANTFGSLGYALGGYYLSRS